MKILPFFSLLLASLLAIQCAKRCPKDINLGDIDLQSTTRSWLPAAQKVNSMTFSRTDGMQQTFTNNSSGEERFEYAVETLCERGDFLDKTVQTAYFNAQSIHYNYNSGDGKYTLSLDIMPSNAGDYGSRSDTLFYESLAVWGQKISEPSRVGSFTVLTSDRGNTLSQTLLDNTNHFAMVADTVLNGKVIKNAWVPASDGKQTLFVFYTKENGIEAFTTDTEIWTRD